MQVQVKSAAEPADGHRVAVAREREIEMAPELAAPGRGVPLAVVGCVVVVELAWLAALAFLAWLLVSSLV